jgi:hydrogenase expression/formation protein HypE
MSTNFNLNCPAPLPAGEQIQLAHGGGGRMSLDLVRKLFQPEFSNAALKAEHDGAVLKLDDQRVAFTTDSHVVHPLFFPGGDIGTLAVNGTVNDLAMCGARPRWLSAAFILEEGLPMETLRRVVDSMKRAAADAQVELVTGDTKVVDRGKADGMFVTTSGVGVLEHDVEISPSHVQAGDVVLLSGDLGRHGTAVMSVREGLEFESPIESDCAPLASPVLALLDEGIEVHCLRDLTRGGLASALNEIAGMAHLQIDIDESAIPVTEAVRGACELLGLDPLYVANEGRFVAFVSPRDLPAALEIMHGHAQGQGACLIGAVTRDTPGLVTVKSRIGVSRVLDLLNGEQLPRIC